MNRLKIYQKQIEIVGKHEVAHILSIAMNFNI